MRRTGGTIEYTERRTIAQYEHKECRFIMAYAFDDGEADIPAKLDEIQAEVRSRVHAMLGLSKPAPITQDELNKARHIPGIKDNLGVEELKPEPKKRVPKPKPPVVAIDDPVEVTPVYAPVVDDDLGPDEPPGITDTDLALAVQERAKALGNAKPVRELITKFTGVVGGKVYAVTQDKREEFLTALAALK